jgi:hypothetical protein
MFLAIYLEILLIVAVIMIFVMKRKITRLLNENVKLYEKIYQLRNSDREKALESDEPSWHVVAPSEFVEEINERSTTLLN